MATVIKEADEPDLFRFITDRNLLAQYDALELAVKVAISKKAQGISHDLLKHLNQVVTKYLSELPGQYRECPIYIHDSDHKPPEYADVFEHIENMIRYIFENWTRKSAIHLAAYALWWINWTHPFVEGNGRTARAVSYYILCVFHAMWFPGTNIIPQQIRANRTPYYEALRKADIAYSLGSCSVDISELESYLSGMLTTQLT